jgi:hypothetical protein
MRFYIGFAGTTNNLAFYLSVKNLRKYREDDSVKLLINNAPIKKIQQRFGIEEVLGHMDNDDMERP